MNNKIAEFIKNTGIDEEKRERILIGFLLGIFLLLAAAPVSDYSKKTKGEKTSEDQTLENENTIISQPDTKKISNDEYISYLENKLEQTIGGMDGAGRVSVMLTLNDGGEKILDKSRSTSPIVVKEQYPDVCGVVVLCEGGDNQALSVEIKEMCGALFALEPHKIVVVKLREAVSKK